MKSNNLNWAFFGTTKFSVMVLDELKEKGVLPRVIVTVEDKPKGRGLLLSPGEVKVWAEQERLPCVQPKTLRDPEIAEMIKKYSSEGFDFFIIFSYGKIIPKSILEIPQYGALNLHPSLLPKLRGPSPIKSAILSESETGITIIKLDEDMDHGPIFAQKKIEMPEWPPYEDDLETKLAHEGGKLLAEILPNLVTEKIHGKEQDHNKATFCKKIEKEDAEINMADKPEINLRKIRAYHIWPGAYFFDTSGKTKKRIVIKRARIEKDTLVLERVTPEGKKEMNYVDYLKGKK